MSEKRSSCPWCFGHGIYAGYWDLGMRRIMEKGTNDRPMFPDEPRYQCDRCGNPKELPKPQKK